ncbi:MAG: LLM class flavin-dependent oxidoreductase [Candidatus Lambdaproteobacteria bacterium]|nr:LLM class flavin-dependent oxidoreductase [Candidatus Lambdaproteobacteria bacterium]
MKIGMFCTNQQQLGTDMVSALDEQIAMVRMARDKGWNSYFVGQHFLNEGDNKALQMVPLLARLASEAGEMTMGTGIMLLPLLNPVYVAETIASLDVIARGNFVFGIGLGYRKAEWDAFGAWKGERAARYETCLDLAKRLWAGEEVSFDSPYCRLDKARLNLRPVQQPHPPIWVAAKHEDAIRRAARVGDCIFHSPKATFETHRKRIGLYMSELRKLGKPFPKENPGMIELYCAKDRKTAMALGAPYLQHKYQTYASWEKTKAMPEEERIDLPFEELMKGRFVIGSPQECYEQLRPYWEQLGIDHFVFRTQFVGMPLANALQSIRLISDELLPALRKAEPRPLAQVAVA